MIPVFHLPMCKSHIYFYQIDKVIPYQSPLFFLVATFMYDGDEKVGTLSENKSLDSRWTPSFVDLCKLAFIACPA